MPEQSSSRRAARAKREGKAGSTQAGAFVREEIERVRAGKTQVKSAKQAIAIGLSKARRAGVKTGASRTASTSTRNKAAQEEAQGATAAKPSPTRSRGAKQALKTASKGATATVGKQALSRQARQAAGKRSAACRSAAAKKAAQTRRGAVRKAAARNAASSPGGGAAKTAARRSPVGKPAARRTAAQRAAADKGTARQATGVERARGKAED